MSRHEYQGTDPIDMDDDATKMSRYGQNEDHQEEIRTEEDHQEEIRTENDDERKDERGERNNDKAEPVPQLSFSAEPHMEPEEVETFPPQNRGSIHAENNADAELEETKDKVETQRDKQPVTKATCDQANPSNKAEDGAKADGENTSTDGHSGERKDEAKSEKARRDNWRQSKSQPEVKKPKEMNGESHRAHGHSLAPAAPKKVGDKLNSIIEGYTTKVRSANSRPEAADKTPPVRVKSSRGSESEPKGHISEIRAKIERSASSVQSRPSLRSFGARGARDAESIDESDSAALEAKRKKKAEEWLNKVVKPSEGGSHEPPDRSGPLSPPGKSQTSTWKKRELELKKEREEREAAQKQLEEKKKKLEEERRLAREASRKLKEQEDATKREQLRHQTTPTTTLTTTTERKNVSLHVTEKTSRSVHSPGARSSPLVKSLSISIEDEKQKKQKAIESRLRPLDLDGLDKDDLEKKAREFYERIRKLEEEKYDLQFLLEKVESELNELKVKTGDAKGKFVKPLLKKVIKKEEGMLANRDDVSFSAKLKTEDDESKLKTPTGEELTNTTYSEQDGGQLDSVEGQDEINNHHTQPAVGQLQTAES